MMQLKINRLLSGGLITNYFCSSKCKHCLYACSPSWKKEYISKNSSELTFRKIRSMGCESIHIGGGEPFLNFSGLMKVLDAAVKVNMRIDYIETNSSWFIEKKKTMEKLSAIKSLGVSTLLISISPFHNEFIPFNKVKGLIDACYDSGIQIFAWIEDFYAEINNLDTCITHNLTEYKRIYGEDYLMRIPERYWTNFGGRAAYTFSKVFPNQSLDEILCCSPCNELEDTSHFHIDLYGKYIPGLCSGFSINIDDLGQSLDAVRYFLIHLLYKQGISALLDYAVKEYGFIAKACYLNKCHLCNEIRKFIVSKNRHSEELQPEEYYQNLNN